MIVNKTMIDDRYHEMLTWIANKNDSVEHIKTLWKGVIKIKSDKYFLLLTILKLDNKFTIKFTFFVLGIWS